MFPYSRRAGLSRQRLQRLTGTAVAAYHPSAVGAAVKRRRRVALPQADG
jgi:hypothetical protein